VPYFVSNGTSQEQRPDQDQTGNDPCHLNIKLNG
jgi:hypothetical protein